MAAEARAQEPEEGGGGEGGVTARQLLVSRMRDIVVVGFPELLCCLVEPVVSSAETVYLGRLGSVFLGATAATTAFFALVSELCCSLSVMTAAAVARDAARVGTKGVRQTMDATLAMAVLLGIAVTLGVVGANHLGVWNMPNVERHVTDNVQLYVAVRAVGIVAFMVSNAAEGCFLGLRDAVTPLAFWTMNGVVSLALLALLWFLGGADAKLNLGNVALATTVGQVVGAGGFLYGLHARGLAGFNAPVWRECGKVLSYASILLVGVVARMTTYNGITASAASLGVVPAAAHKIAYEAYWFLSFLTEPSFTAGNVLVPRELAKGLKPARALVGVIVGFASIIGVSLIAISQAWMRTTLFTSDTAVLEVLKAISPWLALKVFLSSNVYAIEGVIIGLGKLRYLSTIHVLNACIMVNWGMHAARNGLGIEVLWISLALYQLLRIVEHTLYFATAKPFQNALAD